MDLIDALTIVMLTIPVILILSKVHLNSRMKRVYVEERFNEVKRIRI